MKHILQNKATVLFLILGAFFVTNALVAEMIGTKLFSVEKLFGVDPLNFKLFGETVSFTMTAGVLLWPVVFIMTDIINEYFGPKGVRFLSFLVIGLIIYAFIMIYAAIGVPPADFFVTAYQDKGIEDMNVAFKGVFGQGLWIIAGSLIAFLVGQIVDVTVFHKIRKVTGEDKLWLRATGSTLVSQLIDSFVVLLVAFYFSGVYPLVWVLAVGLVNFVYKAVVAVILTPLLYIIHNWIDRYLGKDLSQQLQETAANN
ncbi:MAG: queuosine precursor transporter [Saprospiraceae bacterium]|nr:queuosine precursor transporter [Saprospiraceae bacterium]